MLKKISLFVVSVFSLVLAVILRIHIETKGISPGLSKAKKNPNKDPNYDNDDDDGLSLRSDRKSVIELEEEEEGKEEEDADQREDAYFKSRKQNLPRTPRKDDERGSQVFKRDFGWMVDLSNLSIIIWIVSTLWLHIVYLNGREWSVFVLSPFLLLLQPTASIRLFKQLNQNNRYLPVFLVIIISLSLIALLSTWAPHLLIKAKLNIIDEGLIYSFFKRMQTTAFLLFTWPTAVLFLKFLNQPPGSSTALFGWLLATPLNVISVFSSVFSIRLLSIINFLFALTVLVRVVYHQFFSNKMANIKSNASLRKNI